MTKQKSIFFFSALMGLCMLLVVVTSGCNDEKKSSTESTMTDSSTISTPAPGMDTMMMHGDTNEMDTASTRPIVPGT